ncbi:MAG TPA: hypothetical protein VGO93_06080, partial [Candidatus Xenobia bacterium]
MIQNLFNPAGTTAPAFKKPVEISFNPQEPGVMPAETVTIEGTQMEPGLVSPRVRIAEPQDFPTPHADGKGNYVFAQDDPRFDDAETYACVTRALAMAENCLGRQLPWGFSQDLGRDQLIVHPHAGTNNANAFYKGDAGSLNFFSFTDPATHEMERTGDSSDIVSHETGHALLDALRRDYLKSASVSSSGFHEAFGDMTAITMALYSEKVVDQLWDQTQGDLTQPNLVAHLAERLGNASAHMDGSDGPGFLRNANNDYKYADQHFLPFTDKNHPNSAPGQECHAYSNLFTGAFWDVLNGVYKDIMASDKSLTFKQGIAQARDVSAKLLYRGMEFAPVGDINYKTAAEAMMKADEVDTGGKYRGILEDVFRGRQILTGADLKAYDQHENALPDVSLDAKVKDGDSAMAFLKANASKLDLPDDRPWNFLDKRTNDKGETFLLYDFTKKFDLAGTQFGTLDGAKMETTGGLLLAFDKGGKLIEDNFDDVTDNDIQDMQDGLVSANKHGAVMLGTPAVPSQNDITMADG